MSIQTDQVNLELNIGGQQAGTTLRDLNQSARALRAELSRLPIDTQAFADKAGELRKVNDQIKEINNNVRGMHSAWEDIKKTFIGFSLAEFFVKGVDAAKEFISSSVEAYRQLEESKKRLDVALADNKALNISREAMQALGDQMQQNSAFSKQQVTDAEALLVPFNKIGTQVFPQALQAAMDLSVGMGKDLNTAIEHVGKALQNPVMGIQTLYREGIALTQEQANQVKSFMAVNNIAAAQGVIIQSLEERYGGMAKAVKDTGSGAITIFNNTITELKENLGGLVVNEILPFVQSLTKAAQALSNWLAPAQAQQTVMEQTRDAFNEEIAVLKTGNLSQEERKKVIDEINSKYGEYLPKLISEKDTLDEITKLQDKANNLLEGKILLQAYQDEITKALKEQLSAQQSSYELQKKQIDLQSQDKGLNPEFSDQIKKQTDLMVGLNQAIADHANSVIPDIENKYSELAKNMGLDWDKLKATLTQTAGGGLDEATLKKIKELRDQLKQLNDQYLLIAASQKDKELAAAAEKYDKLLEDAKGNSALIIEIEKDKVAALAAIDKKYTDDAIKSNADALTKLKQEIDIAISGGPSEFQKQLAETQSYYENLKNQALQFGLDITGLQAAEDAHTLALQQKHNQEIIKQNKSLHDQVLKDDKASAKSEEQIWQHRIGAFQAYGSVVENSLKLISDLNSKNIAFQKAAALAQIAIDTGVAIANAVAMASRSDNPISFGVELALITAAVLSGIDGAIQDVKKAPVPQYARGAIVDRPTAVYGEDGPEAFIPLGDKYRDRGVQLWFEAGKRLNIPQFNTSSISSQATTNHYYNNSSGASGDSTNQMLVSVLLKLHQRLSEPINAIWDWDYDQRTRKRMAQIQKKNSIGK